MVPSEMFEGRDACAAGPNFLTIFCRGFAVVTGIAIQRLCHPPRAIVSEPIGQTME